IVQLTYLLLFAVAGLVWLVLRTDYDLLTDNIDRLLILFVAMVLLLLQPFSLRVRLDREGDEFDITSSLAPLILWSALFISGAAGLWAMVLAAIVSALWRGTQLARYGENPVWEPLSTFVQQMGTYIFATMVAAIVYLEAGGVFPMTSTDANDWIPALVAILIGALLAGVLMLPVAIQIESLVGSSIKLGNIARFYLGTIALPLIMSPFAIIIALLNAEGRTVSLVFIIIGVWLVNRLAHHMSQADDRSRQLAREFAELEALGEALIEAPADASTLSDVMASYVPRIFPVESVEILLFEPEEKTVWSPFQVVHPESITPVPDEIWNRLRQSKESHIVVGGVTLPGERFTFGDALVAKISVEESSEESEQKCIGGVYLLRHGSVGKTIDSLATVQSLASQVSSAVHRAEVHAETMAFHKTQQELEFAGRVQNSFLPSTIPDPDKWQITATLEPARQTSGDFYDFIPLTDTTIGIVVADVSDKGTGAALYMALTRTLIRTYAMESKNKPELALTRANERIFTDTESDQFVTLIYGILDTSKGLFTYANAGHNPGYLLRSGAGSGESMEVDVLRNTGIPLGMFEGMEWKRAKVKMNPGDVLMLYSDGVPEAEDADQNEYGDVQFLKVGKANAQRPAVEIQDAVLKSVHEFTGDAPQFDDITLVVVARDRKG
ncbi:MAG: PP2C family protein-serine/threonine phosphatase, partial [Candidatus Promineifilaceae bacterium]